MPASHGDQRAGGNSPEREQRHGFLRMVTGAGILTTSRILGDMASALLFIGISRVYGVDGTGLYSYAFAVAQIAFLLIDFGLLDYTMREYASSEPKARRPILAHAMMLQFFFSVFVVIGLRVYLSVTGATREASTVAWLLTAYLVLGHIGRMLFIPAFTTQRMKWPAIAEVCFRVGGTLAAFLLIVYGNIDLTVSLGILPAAAGLMVVCVVLVARRVAGPYRRQFEARRAWRILRASAVFACSSLFTGLLAKIGLIILTYLSGITAAGIFATGLKLVDFSMVPLLFLGVAVYPRLALSYKVDRTDLFQVADQFMRLSFTLGALACWGMVFVVPPLLPWLLGDEFSMAIPIVKMGGLAAFLMALDLASIRVLWSLRMQDYRLRIQMAGLLANVACNLTLIPWIGAKGAMLTAILTTALMLSLAWKPIRRQWPQTEWKRMVSACGIPAAAGMGIGLAALLAPIPLAVAAPLPLFGFLLAGLLSGLYRGVLGGYSSSEPIVKANSVDVERLEGPVMVLSPHYDDESLGCGGTIALLASRADVHVVHVSSGRLVLPKDRMKKTHEAEAMPAIRHAEAMNALGVLGVPAAHAHSLSLPDGELAKHTAAIEQGLRECLRSIRPLTLFVPFRHDQHPDHLAVYRAARRILADAPQITVLEYFVYYRYPWLPERDIRAMIDPSRLLAVDIEATRTKKRAALQEYPSQTTCFMPHQTQPTLQPALLDEQCTGPEIFLQAEETLPDRKLFRRHSRALKMSLRYAFRFVQWKKKLWPAPIQ